MAAGLPSVVVLVPEAPGLPGPVFPQGRGVPCFPGAAGCADSPPCGPGRGSSCVLVSRQGWGCCACAEDSEPAAGGAGRGRRVCGLCPHSVDRTCGLWVGSGGPGWAAWPGVCRLPGPSAHLPFRHKLVVDPDGQADASELRRDPACEGQRASRGSDRPRPEAPRGGACTLGARLCPQSAGETPPGRQPPRPPECGRALLSLRPMVGRAAGTREAVALDAAARKGPAGVRVSGARGTSAVSRVQAREAVFPRVPAVQAAAPAGPPWTRGEGGQHSGRRETPVERTTRVRDVPGSPLPAGWGAAVPAEGPDGARSRSPSSLAGVFSRRPAAAGTTAAGTSVGLAPRCRTGSSSSFPSDGLGPRRGRGRRVPNSAEPERPLSPRAPHPTAVAARTPARRHLGVSGESLHSHSRSGRTVRPHGPRGPHGPHGPVVVPGLRADETGCG